MKGILLSLVMIGITLTAFSQTKETRTVSGFTGIDASSVFDITVSKGATESLSIEADDNILPYVRSEVKNGVLRLYLDKDKEVKNVKTLKANVVMKTLDKVWLSGACKLSGSDQFTSDDFKSNCSGASGLNLNIKTGQLTMSSSGASDIKINAEVATDVKIDVSGASSTKVKLDAAKIQFNASGVTKVEIAGSATEIMVDMSGTSNIKAADLVVKKATIEMSGTSNIEVNVTETLKASTSGAATVNYKGSPTIEWSNSGSSKLKKI